MATQTAVLQMHQRDTFERNVTRSLAAGAAAGAVAYLSSKVLHLSVPMTYLALAAVLLACIRGDRLDRLMLGTLALVMPALPWFFGFSHAWTLALAGAVTGALMVKARLAEKGVMGTVGFERPGLLHYGVASVATAGLTVAGFQVAKIFVARLGDIATPALLSSAVGGTIIALFAALGSLAAHLALKADPVEARCEELIPSLKGEFQTQATRALTLYRLCGVSLAALPREPAREELSRTLQQLTRDAVELAANWAGVESQLEDDAVLDLEKEISNLGKDAAKTKDIVARRQLELAAASLKEELERLSELKLKRERILAKLKGQVALLERARVSLIGMRSGHAQVKAAELTALARKFGALANAQADEAKLAHEVATGAEIAAQESEAAAMGAAAPVLSQVRDVAEELAAESAAVASQPVGLKS